MSSSNLLRKLLKASEETARLADDVDGNTSRKRARWQQEEEQQNQQIGEELATEEDILQWRVHQMVTVDRAMKAATTTTKKKKSTGLVKKGGENSPAASLRRHLREQELARRGFKKGEKKRKTSHVAFDETIVTATRSDWRPPRVEEPTYHKRQHQRQKEKETLRKIANKLKNAGGPFATKKSRTK